MKKLAIAIIAVIFCLAALTSCTTQNKCAAYGEYHPSRSYANDQYRGYTGN